MKKMDRDRMENGELRMEKLNGKSKDIAAENIAKLKELFPEAFTEGKVDFDALKEVLGTFVDDRDERYSFTWNGKSKARMIAQTPSTGTLRPCKEESVHWDTTQNIFIEGDNLEVLKLLQKSYHKKVKMIYIDPPYNTGKDFVYKDNFKDNIKNYKEITGQVDGEGRNLSNNPETSGRYHTDWLNMMYPRLKLARNLLKDDGVIFISIDDSESCNLKKICDEIFGEENFIAHFIHKNNSSKNQAKLVSVSTEYFYCYSKSKEWLKEVEWRLRKKGAEDIAKQFRKLKTNGLSLDEISDEIKEMYKRPKYAHLSRWNKVDEKGVFKDADLSREGGPKDYTIVNPFTGVECKVPDRGWGKSLDELQRLQDSGLIWYGSDDTPPGLKDYINPDDVSVPDNFWYYDNSVDTRWVKNEFGSLVFQNPKPLEMIKSIIEMVGPNENDLVVDFFAGSSTTAHSLFELAISDKIKRRFLLVQLPEKLDDTEKKKKDNKDAIQFLEKFSLPVNLAEISKERIRRSAAKIKEENPEYDGDLGFKVFKLDSTNIKPWEVDFDLTEEQLSTFVENIKTDRREEDILYEILLKYGLDLTLPITEHNIAGQKVFDIGMGALIICLADAISLEVVEGIVLLVKQLKPEYKDEKKKVLVTRVVFKDSGFKNDVVKTNAVQILRTAGIEDVKSL
jgi:adenine-specific DNA-methyltransferase